MIQGIEAIPCPFCHERLYHYDSRDRSVRIDEDKQYHFRLRRLRCTQCKKIHLELPDFLLPNARCFKSVIGRAIKGEAVAVVRDPRTPKRWRRWWRRFSGPLRAALESLIHRELLDEKSRDKALPDLVKVLVNHRLWPFHLLWNWSPPSNPLHSP